MDKPRKSVRELVEEAEARVTTITVQEFSARHNDNTLVIDLRDVRELWREGKIPGALHAPRGMLEFWVDPDSPYYREDFDTSKDWVLYCAIGWRSALAADTLQNMGFENVCHIGGGFQAWQEAEEEIETVEKR